MPRLAGVHLSGSLAGGPERSGRPVRGHRGTRPCGVLSDGCAVRRKEFPHATLALTDAQRGHGQDTYQRLPGMYGDEPSVATVYAAQVLSGRGTAQVLELDAGNGQPVLRAQWLPCARE